MCPPFVNSGAFVAPTEIAGPYPKSKGGTVASGVYELTKLEKLASLPGPKKLKATLRVVGNQLEMVGQEEGQTEERVAGTFVEKVLGPPTGGAGGYAGGPPGVDYKLSITATCPFPGGQLDIGYTATPTTVTLFFFPTVQTFSKK